MENKGASFPLFPILGIAFVVLKLTHVIGWSWLWVLAPFWGPLVVGGVIVMALLLAALIAVICGAGKNKDSATRLRVVGK